MAAPTYLVKNRSGLYLFRRIIPKHLRELFGEQIAIRQSLQTHHKPTALKLARQLAVKTEMEFLQLNKKKYQQQHMIAKGRAKSASTQLQEIADFSSIEELEAVTSDRNDLPPELNRTRDQVETLEDKLAAAQSNMNEMKLFIARAEELEAIQHQAKVDAQVEKDLGVPPGTLAKGYIEPDSPLFSTLWEEYREHKFRLGKWYLEGRGTERVRGYDNEFNDFLEIIDGDMPASRFTKEDANRLVDGLLSFPLRRRQKFPGIALSDIPADCEKLDPNTASQRLSLLKGFFAYIHEEEYTRYNRLRKKHIERDSRNYATPTNQDIREWFNLPVELITSAWQFWIPRIALLTGARQKELAQLKPDDIKQDEDTGIWYMVIHDAGDNDAKTEAAIRRVPIPKTLIDNRFLEYWRMAKRLSPEALWPEFANLKPDGAASAVGKYWTALKNKHHVLTHPLSETGRPKVFHSLRRVILNRLVGREKDGIGLTTLQCIVGHEPSLGSSEAYLDDPAPLDAKQYAIDQLIIEGISWKHAAKFSLKKV